MIGKNDIFGAKRCASLVLGAAIPVLFVPCLASAQDDASDEMRAIIMGPLEAELRAPSNVVALSAPRLDDSRYSLRFVGQSSASEPNAFGLARPAASRFAEAVLVSHADDITRDGLSAFSAREAVLATSPSGSRLSLSMFEADRPDIARLTFDPDYAEAAGSALVPGTSYETRRMALNFEGAFDSPGGADGFDIGLSPRAGVSFGEQGPAAAAGATVRMGQYLDAFNSDRPAWWFFAGADRQAVMYDPGQGFDMRDALAMEPYAVVGDAQAGVAMHLRGADFSLAYIHRETRYEMPTEAWETSEGFAAFSLTWRR